MANLVTLQQYKDFTGITGVNEDAKINVIVPAISQAVKTYCGTSFVDYYSTDKTEKPEAFTFAKLIEIKINVKEAARKTTLENGYFVWLLTLKS